MPTKFPPHAPADVLVQPLHERVAALEGPDGLHVGVVDPGDDRSFGELARPAGNGRVPEPVDGEPRLPPLGALSPEHILVAGACLAQRPRRQVAVDEDLGMAQCHAGAARPGHGDRQPADQVLPEVEKERPVIATHALHRRDDGGAADGRPFGRGQR